MTGHRETVDYLLERGADKQVLTEVCDTDHHMQPYLIYHNVLSDRIREIFFTWLARRVIAVLF